MKQKYDAEKHHRRSIRLKEYDYSQAGAYFVTVCTHNRECILGEVANGEVLLNEFGKIVESVWFDLPKHYPNVELDAFVIMPNHVHGIIIVGADPVGAGFKPAPTTAKKPAPTGGYALSEVVRGFKTFSARRINEIRATSGTPVWQRNYYEHIVRDEDRLNRIREYIINNPMRWQFDRENPDRMLERTYDNQWSNLEEEIYGKTKQQKRIT
ncbi:MAG: transposase [Anaerolineae bacterium]|nr:transposase [Anaerolineae bacterium]